MKLNEITSPSLTKDQLDWLKAMGITNYSVNANGLIDVNSDVDISFKKLTSIPVQFGHVSGFFYCNNNNLTSLQGAPQSVSGDFFCYRNNLTSLQGAPQIVSGDFSCSGNNLPSLQGAPQIVSGDFFCSGNNLTSLHNIHKQIKSIKGSFICDNKIKSHILGLLLIRDLKKLEGIREVEHIINKHLIDKDVHLCQEDLIEAGFAEMGKL